MDRTSPSSFMICDVEDSNTKIIQKNIKGEHTTIQEFDSVYTSWDFSNDNALLLNREGDILFYNFLSKNTFLSEKQHPGLYADANVMHTDEHFVTCGGCVKNPNTLNSERIIKVWKMQENDTLTQRTRMNTGHKRPVQYSFMMNKTHVVTVGTDRFLIFNNIVVQQMQCILDLKFDPLCVCQIDYNSVIVGGNGKHLQVYDLRLKKSVISPVKLEWDLIQVVNMTRLTDYHLMVSNINELHTLDMRTWKTKQIGEYEGQRISQVLTLNSRQLVVGNR